MTDFLEHLLLFYLGLIGAVSALTFIVCAYDKFAAKRAWYRVPERRLFWLSALGGALGMLLGMLILRHKTRHVSFKIFVPLLAIIQFVAALLLYRYF